MVRAPWILLGVALVLGVSSFVFTQIGSQEPVRLLSGDRLEDVGSGSLEAAISDRCLPVYFGSPTCTACALLAKNWLETSPPPGTWIMQGSSDEVRRWAAEYRIPWDRVVVLGEVEKNLNLVQLGVFATPTSAVLDWQGRLQHVRVGPTLVTDDVIRGHCETNRTEQ
jgi:hypothetical protein